MMRYLRYGFLAVLGIVLVSISLANREMVELKLMPDALAELLGFNMSTSLPLFIVVLGYGIWMGLDVDCGCFGPDGPEAKAFHGLRLSLYRDLVMLVGASLIYGWRRYRTIAPKSIGLISKNLIQRRRTQNAFG